MEERTQLDSHVQEFATRSRTIRKAITAHQRWIEEKLGISLAEAVIVDGLPNLSQVGVHKCLGIPHRRRAGQRPITRLVPLVAKAEAPPDFPPVVTMSDEFNDDGHSDTSVYRRKRAGEWAGLDWSECPLALRLHVYDCTVVLLNVPYIAGPASTGESAARVLLARREDVPTLLRLFGDIFRRESTPHLFTIGSRPSRISRGGWNDLVLGENVLSLLKNDFESFWDRREWFRERNLPFRRGYLLHGPPGNGKTSAIRAMMTSRGLNAFTLRFFDPNTDDSDLDMLFDKARRDRPAIVLFEDIDRAFPRTGESNCRLSLQHLLNSLDGVASGEGIVVIATANEPTALDPAILRRPGRFDRLIHFPNPDDLLRLEYFRRMNSGLTDDQLRRSVEASNGFSFAQLREAYVMAGQFAFERGDEVTEDDLLTGVRSLRQGMINSARHSGSAGFGACEEVCR